MYDKCYNAKFQVQDDEQQLNGEKGSNPSGGFLFISVPVVSDVCGGGAFDQLMETMALSSALWHGGLPAAKSGITAGDRAP